MVYEARDAVGLASFEDRRMWRLLLARLHPDAGGDQALFTFACAVRDEMSKGKHPAKATKAEDKAQDTHNATPFLRTWHEAMGHWSSGNRDALDNLWTR
ncbi:hypothetical protein BH18ACT11_BH18ACT11_29770 [soil metagenome]